MTLAGPKLKELIEKLIAATEKGRVSDWNERLADILRAAGGHPARICWVKAPWHVAFEIAQEIGTRGDVSALERALDEALAKQGEADDAT